MNENKETKRTEHSDGILSGKGFYIVLLLCVAVIGISGYVMSRAGQSMESVSSLPDLQLQYDPADSEPVNAPVTGLPKATATPTPKPTKSPTPSAIPTVKPTVLSFIRPLSGEVTATFSGDTLVFSSTMNDWRVHTGLDLRADVGAPVSAAADGEISAVYSDDLFGAVVEISHADGYLTRYANLAEPAGVSVGQTVTAGDAIGQVGSTALCETAEPGHLHFEVWKNGKCVDPETVLPTPEE